MKIKINKEEPFNADNYPIVRFDLIDTHEFNVKIDNIRKELGYRTFYDESDPNMWDEGWYDYFLYFDMEKNLPTEIEVKVVANSDKIEDDQNSYYFDFDPNDVLQQLFEQIIYDEIKEEVR